LFDLGLQASGNFTLVVWLVIVAVETVHGILRARTMDR
jgi:hypothetical protein